MLRREDYILKNNTDKPLAVGNVVIHSGKTVAVKRKLFKRKAAYISRMLAEKRLVIVSSMEPVSAKEEEPKGEILDSNAEGVDNTPDATVDVEANKESNDSQDELDTNVDSEDDDTDIDSEVKTDEPKDESSDEKSSEDEELKEDEESKEESKEESDKIQVKKTVDAPKGRGKKK